MPARLPVLPAPVRRSITRHRQGYARRHGAAGDALLALVAAVVVLGWSALGLAAATLIAPDAVTGAVVAALAALGLA